MYFNCAQILCLKIGKTSIGIQKIDGSTLKYFRIVITDFLIEDKIDKSGYFQEINLVADIKIEIIFEMSLLKDENANILFRDKMLR